MVTLMGKLNNYEYPFRYADLLALHIRLAMLCEGGETSILRNWGTDYAADVQGYFKQLPKFLDEIEKKGVNRLLCIDMWCIMMVRECVGVHSISSYLVKGFLSSIMGHNCLLILDDWSNELESLSITNFNSHDTIYFSHHLV